MSVRNPRNTGGHARHRARIRRVLADHRAGNPQCGRADYYRHHPRRQLAQQPVNQSLPMRHHLRLVAAHAGAPAARQHDGGKFRRCLTHWLGQLPEPVARPAPRFRRDAAAANHRRPVHPLDHVDDRQRSHRHHG